MIRQIWIKKSKVIPEVVVGLLEISILRDVGPGGSLVGWWLYGEVRMVIWDGFVGMTLVVIGIVIRYIEDDIALVGIILQLKLEFQLIDQLIFFCSLL